MSDWKEENNAMRKTFLFKDFEAAMEFMQKASPLINTLDHHPDWSNCYNKVHVSLTTHDASNKITEKDHALAKLLDEVYAAPVGVNTNRGF
jgi:4a-hydroxytetrahydrobiopterin dehydratase